MTTREKKLRARALNNSLAEWIRMNESDNIERTYHCSEIIDYNEEFQEVIVKVNYTEKERRCYMLMVQKEEENSWVETIAARKY